MRDRDSVNTFASEECREPFPEAHPYTGLQKLVEPS